MQFSIGQMTDAYYFTNLFCHYKLRYYKANLLFTLFFIRTIL